MTFSCRKWLKTYVYDYMLMSNKIGMKRSDILVVDDEDDIREMLRDILEEAGYDTILSSNSEDAYNILRNNYVQLVVLDIWLHGKNDGFNLLEYISARYPDVQIIIISGHGNTDSAVKAIKMGAYDYISKPFNSERILLTIQHAISSAKLFQENRELKSSIKKKYVLIGDSHEMRNLNNITDKLAKTSSRIMITGASGVGKEVVARIIHQKSKFFDQPFVVLHAASFSQDAYEEKIFGIASIGNNPPQIGLLENANNGTLYVDEITDLSLELQAILLKIIQENKFCRVNDNKQIPLNIRIISSSSKDPFESMSKGIIREDLFYRLNVVPVRIPSLSEHITDIPLLAEHFLSILSEETGMITKRWSPEAMSVMQSYEWPGNVRQLRNVIEWILIMSADTDASLITVNDLPPYIMADTHMTPSNSNINLSVPLREARENFEKKYLKLHLKRFAGNITKTAEFVGMERSALHRKLKMLNLFFNEVNK